MRYQVALLLALALTLPMAGCLADDGGEPVDPQSKDGPVDPDPRVNLRNVTPLAFGDGDAGRRTFQEAGSFGPSETLLPAGWANGNWERSVNLAPRVPTGVPAHVNVTVTYEDNAPDVFYELDAYLQSEKGELYTYDHTVDTSRQVIWLDAVVGLQGGHDLTLVLEGIWPDDGSVEYTANILVEQDPTYVPHRVPVEVPLTETTGGVVLTGVGGAPVTAEAMMWGPDDSFLGRVSTQGEPLVLNLTPERVPGAYVLFLTSVTPENATAPPVVQVRPVAPQEDAVAAPQVRMLQTELVEGAPHAVEQGQTVEWSFTPRPSPIQAGIAIRDAQDVAVHYSVQNDWSVEIVSAAGEVLAFEDGEFPPVWFGNSLVYWSDVGQENLVGGGYDVSFTLHQSTPVEATELLLTYQR